MTIRNPSFESNTQWQQYQHGFSYSSTYAYDGNQSIYAFTPYTGRRAGAQQRINLPR